MNIKPVSYVNFNAKSEPELIKKLNTVANHERRAVHNLVRLVLTDWLDARIREINQVSTAQPA